MSGFEVLGIVASVIQIADVGARLSVKLCTFSHRVKHADSNIRNISSDVALTCSVLRELGVNLEKDEQSRLCNNRAVETAEGVITECMKVFTELEGAIDGKVMDIDGKKSIFKKIGKGVKFSLVEPQVELLRSNLDRLKSTLLLMLNVIIYAGQLRSKAKTEVLQEQQELIKTLNEEKKENDRKFDQLTRAIEGFGISQDGGKRLKRLETNDSAYFSQPNSAKSSISNLQRLESARSAVQFNMVQMQDTGASTWIPSKRMKIQPDSEPALPSFPPPHESSGVLSHYCELVKNLLVEVDAVQYRLNSRIRGSLRNGIIESHHRTTDDLTAKHGNERVYQIFNQALGDMAGTQLPQSSMKDHSFRRASRLVELGLLPKTVFTAFHNAPDTPSNVENGLAANPCLGEACYEPPDFTKIVPRQIPSLVPFVSDSPPKTKPSLGGLAIAPDNQPRTRPVRERQVDRPFPSYSLRAMSGPIMSDVHSPGSQMSLLLREPATGVNLPSPATLESHQQQSYPSTYFHHWFPPSSQYENQTQASFHTHAEHNSAAELLDKGPKPASVTPFMNQGPFHDAPASASSAAVGSTWTSFHSTIVHEDPTHRKLYFPPISHHDDSLARDELEITPMVSPTRALPISKFSIPGEYFSPLTSPALNARTLALDDRQSAISVPSRSDARTHPESIWEGVSPSAGFLASKSHYEDILKGTHLPVDSNLDNLAESLTSTRKSYKIAEQGRRTRIHTALKELETLLPQISAHDLAATKTSDKDAEEPGIALTSVGGNLAADKARIFLPTFSKAATVETTATYIKSLQAELAETKSKLEKASAILLGESSKEVHKERSKRNRSSSTRTSAPVDRQAPFKRPQARGQEPSKTAEADTSSTDRVPTNTKLKPPVEGVLGLPFSGNNFRPFNTMDSGSMAAPRKNASQSEVREIKRQIQDLRGRKRVRPLDDSATFSTPVESLVASMDPQAPTEINVQFALSERIDPCGPGQKSVGSEGLGLVDDLLLHWTTLDKGALDIMNRDAGMGDVGTNHCLSPRPPGMMKTGSL